MSKIITNFAAFNESFDREDDYIPNSEDHTELELKVWRHFRDTSEPLYLTKGQYLLGEFADGYASGHYGDSEEDQELIDKFLKIVRADEEGQYEYNVNDMEIIVSAIERFGL